MTKIKENTLSDKVEELEKEVERLKKELAFKRTEYQWIDDIEEVKKTYKVDNSGIGKMLGVTERTINDYLKGRKPPSSTEILLDEYLGKPFRGLTKRFKEYDHPEYPWVKKLDKIRRKEVLTNDQLAHRIGITHRMLMEYLDGFEPRSTVMVLLDLLSEKS